MIAGEFMSAKKYKNIYLDSFQTHLTAVSFA